MTTRHSYYSKSIPYTHTFKVNNYVTPNNFGSSSEFEDGEEEDEDIEVPEDTDIDTGIASVSDHEPETDNSIEEDEHQGSSIESLSEVETRQLSYASLPSLLPPESFDTLHLYSDTGLDRRRRSLSASPALSFDSVALDFENDEIENETEDMTSEEIEEESNSEDEFVNVKVKVEKDQYFRSSAVKVTVSVQPPSEIDDGTEAYDDSGESEGSQSESGDESEASGTGESGSEQDSGESGDEAEESSKTNEDEHSNNVGNKTENFDNDNTNMKVNEDEDTETQVLLKAEAKAINDFEKLKNKIDTDSKLGKEAQTVATEGTEIVVNNLLTEGKSDVSTLGKVESDASTLGKIISEGESVVHNHQQKLVNETSLAAMSQDKSLQNVVKDGTAEVMNVVKKEVGLNGRVEEKVTTFGKDLTKSIENKALNIQPNKTVEQIDLGKIIQNYNTNMQINALQSVVKGAQTNFGKKVSPATNANPNSNVVVATALVHPKPKSDTNVENRSQSDQPSTNGTLGQPNQDLQKSVAPDGQLKVPEMEQGMEDKDMTSLSEKEDYLSVYADSADSSDEDDENIVEQRTKEQTEEERKAVEIAKDKLLEEWKTTIKDSVEDIDDKFPHILEDMVSELNLQPLEAVLPPDLKEAVKDPDPEASEDLVSENSSKRSSAGSLQSVKKNDSNDDMSVKSINSAGSAKISSAHSAHKLTSTPMGSPKVGALSKGSPKLVASASNSPKFSPSPKNSPKTYSSSKSSPKLDSSAKSSPKVASSKGSLKLDSSTKSHPKLASKGSPPMALVKNSPKTVATLIKGSPKLNTLTKDVPDMISSAQEKLATITNNPPNVAVVTNSLPNLGISKDLQKGDAISSPKSSTVNLIRQSSNLSLNKLQRVNSIELASKKLVNNVATGIESSTQKAKTLGESAIKEIDTTIDATTSKPVSTSHQVTTESGLDENKVPSTPTSNKSPSISLQASIRTQESIEEGSENLSVYQLFPENMNDSIQSGDQDDEREESPGSRRKWKNSTEIASTLSHYLHLVKTETIENCVTEIIPLLTQLLVMSRKNKLEHDLATLIASLSAVRVLCDRLLHVKVMSGEKALKNMDLSWLLRVLCKISADPESKVKPEASFTLAKLVKASGPELITRPIYFLLVMENEGYGHRKGSQGSKTKAAALDTLTYALITFPKEDFDDLEEIARWVCLVVFHPHRRVRQAALECISVLGNRLGSPDAAITQFRKFIVNEAEQQYNPSGSDDSTANQKSAIRTFDGKGTFDVSAITAISSRIRRRILPLPSTQGLIEYGVKVPTGQELVVILTKMQEKEEEEFEVSTSEESVISSHSKDDIIFDEDESETESIRMSDLEKAFEDEKKHGKPAAKMEHDLPVVTNEIDLITPDVAYILAGKGKVNKQVHGTVDENEQPNEAEDTEKAESEKLMKKELLKKERKLNKRKKHKKRRHRRHSEFEDSGGEDDDIF